MLKKCMLVVFVAMLLIGCGESDGVDEPETDSQQGIVSSLESSDSSNSSGVFVQGIDPVVFSYKDKIPIIADGIVYGDIEIKQCEKLGIWDWTNKEAVGNNVHSSYSINLQYDLSESAGFGDSRNFKCEAFIVDGKGNTVGRPCCVGWSGFSDEVILLQDNLKGRLEVGVQPEQKVTKKMKLLLRVSDSEGTNYDDVVIGNHVFRDAVKGPSVLKKGEKRNVTSVNGAKYFVKLGTVEYERQLDVDSNPIDCFVFRYSLGYTKKPTRHVKVAKFDEYNHYKMSSTLVVGMSTSGSNEQVYSNYPEARRYMFSDSTSEGDTEMYVTTSGIYIDTGTTATYVDNRLAPKTLSVEPEYVRLSVEFPEEQAARTPDQMMRFNGRFIVYQIAPTERRLHARR